MVKDSRGLFSRTMSVLAQMRKFGWQDLRKCEYCTVIFLPITELEDCAEIIINESSGWGEASAWNQ